MTESKLYQLQIYLENLLKEKFSQIDVLSRRKGDVESDVENSLARIGLAIIVQEALPSKISAGLAINFDEVDISISIIENVALNSLEIDGVSVHAQEILEEIIRALDNARFENSPLRFGSVDSDYAQDEPILILNLNLKTSLIIN